MDFTPALLFGIAGTLAGLIASGLGLAALNHLPAATKTDRVVGWTLWWWLDTKRYDSEGQRLLDSGGLLLEALRVVNSIRTFNQLLVADTQRQRYA
jgi:predicted cobalt transporter CbtA